jgi:hypothetical protein
MLIAAVAIFSALLGLSLAHWGQKVEAKAADNHSVDDWNEFVKAMGGKRR